jgi:hypothetical protein
MTVGRRAGVEIDRTKTGDPKGVESPLRQYRRENAQRLFRAGGSDRLALEDLVGAASEKRDALGPAEFDTGIGQAAVVAGSAAQQLRI